MHFGIAADHGGFVLREPVALLLQSLGHELTDFGATLLSREDDYPDLIAPLAESVARGEVNRGIAICGSGIGACVVANKIPGVRASVCHDTYSARQGVEHDDLNILVIGARVVGPELAAEIVRAFANAKFGGEARHVRRLEKLRKIEQTYWKANLESEVSLP